PPLRNQPELERSPAMGTVALEQPHPSLPIAEDDQLLPEDRDVNRHVSQVIGEADRLPEAAEVLAARRSGTDVGEFCVLSGNLAMVVGAVARRQEGGSRHGGPSQHRCGSRSRYGTASLGLAPRTVKDAQTPYPRKWEV